MASCINSDNPLSCSGSGGGPAKAIPVDVQNLLQAAVSKHLPSHRPQSFFPGAQGPRPVLDQLKGGGPQTRLQDCRLGSRSCEELIRWTTLN
mmetsp:Transcript_12941/g.20329  ORF Transcript_12941/g.20329 Transcript_12941/m.20329 type:complete len:92 (+) Transcript_12941:432-707(+)